jgi:acyl-CoA synthetase (AMP-forming)/AMP-acid ligase II
VLSGAHEPVGDFIDRAATDGVTHISGTPSHWRRALMSPLLAPFKPNYVRLSGEPADQAILDQLKRAFPAARLSHAFASTEAGVAFDVRDGRAGIPAAYIDDNGTPQEGVQAELILRDGVLCIRSSRTAQQYLGAVATPLADADGFVATNDMLERREDRYFFIGRQEGVINVGGQKVYPEEVEAVINQHPDVRMSRVRARVSPITGAIVTADIVLHPGVALDHARANPIRDEIAQRCRDHLAAHKVPVSLKIVPSLDISAAGKLLRGRA